MSYAHGYSGSEKRQLLVAESLLKIDTSKLGDALDVTSLSESDVYDIEEREYVRKADVESRLIETLVDRLLILLISRFTVDQSSLSVYTVDLRS